MPDTSSSRISYSAAALFLLVVALLIAPIGALVTNVIAQTMGGNQPPRLLVAADPLSDAVSAAAKPALPDILFVKSLKALFFLLLGLLAGTAISNF